MPPGKRNARKLYEESALKNTKEKVIQRGLKEINKLAKKGSTHFCLYHQDLSTGNIANAKATITINQKESLRERKHIANFGCERHIHKQ